MQDVAVVALSTSKQSAEKVEPTKNATTDRDRDITEEKNNKDSGNRASSTSDDVSTTSTSSHGPLFDFSNENKASEKCL